MSSLKKENIEGLCGICPAGCWANITKSEGRILSVEHHPDSPSHLCKLGEHSPDIVYSDHRLTHPLLRVGPKGSYDFKKISWNEAYDRIVAELTRIKREKGPEANAIYTGRGSFELSLCDVFQPKDAAISSASSVLFPFGSPNTLGVGALCYVSYAMIAPHVTMGEMLMTMESDFENAETIIVWGGNPATDSPPTDFYRLLKAKERGAKIIVIDPRKTETASACEAEWIPIRPGTDGALALGLINVLIEEELYDEGFVKNWTVGFEELSTYVQHFRPETVEHITKIPADTIIRLAREIASGNGVAPLMYTGLEYSDSGVQAIRATLTLWAIAGQMDTPGGRNITMRQNQFPINRDGLIANPAPKKALAADRFPVYRHYRGESHAIALPEAILESNPYSVSSLIIHGGSIITSWPDAKLWKKALNALDFLVCIDRQFTADAAFADIVLPATTMYEITSYMTYGPMFKIREKVIEPVGESRNDFLIMAELANRLGYGHLYPQTEEALIEHVLKGSGFTPNEVREAGGQVSLEPTPMEYKKWEKGLLRKDGKPGFETPSGKFEIVSSFLEENGFDGLPVYTEPQEGPLSQPELAKDFPLVFNSGARIFEDFRSQHHGIKRLAKDALEPRVTLNSIDAKERGISEADKVIVKTPRGEVFYRAKVTDKIIQGAVECNMGGGGPVGPKAWQECNVNELTDLHRLDPISGFPVYKALLCEVSKVTSAENDFEKTTDNDYKKRLMNRASHSTSSSNANSLDSIRRVYLDHNASTPIDENILETMKLCLKDNWGNPSSIHKQGIDSKKLIENARRIVAQTLNTTARRIVFTGGGSEADNLAIKGLALQQLTTKNPRKTIITSAIEHPAVLQTCKALETLGFNTIFLPVDRKGSVKIEDLISALTPDCFLVSVMWANNEVGSIQPIHKIYQLIQEFNHDHSLSGPDRIFFHSDAVNALGKVSIDLKSVPVDLLSLSAHKIYGPKGIGALYVSKETEVFPLVHGGKQENSIRAGTENLASIVGFSKACEQVENFLASDQKVSGLRDKLETSLLDLVPGSRINGDTNCRTFNTSNITLKDIRGESLVLELDRMGIAFSSGSACKSGSPEPSHVLKAMGLSDEEAHCSIRFSLGKVTQEEDIAYTIDAFSQLLKARGSLIQFSTCR